MNLASINKISGVLVFFLFVSYFTTGYQLFAVAEYGITLVDAALSLFYGYVLYRIVVKGDEMKLGSPTTLVLLLAYMAAIIASSINPMLSGDKVLTIQYIKTSSHLLFYALFPVFVLIYPIKSEVWLTILKFWLVLSVFINLFGFYQMAARIMDWPLAWLSYTNVSIHSFVNNDSGDISQMTVRFGDFFRATSIFSELGAHAGFNLYVISLLLPDLVRGKRLFFKSLFFTVLVFSLSILGVVSTFSLTGLAGVGLIFMFIFIFESGKRRIRLALVLAVSGVIVFGADKISENFTGVSVAKLFQKRVAGILNYGDRRSETVSGESYSGRYASILYANEIWQKYPITGIGLGCTKHNRLNDATYLDMTFLSILTDTGTIGAATFLFFFWYVIFMLARIYRKRSDDDDPTNQLAGIGIYFSVNLIVFNFFSGNISVSPWMWLPAGLLAGAIGNFRIEKIGVYPRAKAGEPASDLFQKRIKAYLYHNT